MGFGGINAHVVVSSPPYQDHGQGGKLPSLKLLEGLALPLSSLLASCQSTEIFPLEGATATTLAAQAEHLANLAGEIISAEAIL